MMRQMLNPNSPSTILERIQSGRIGWAGPLAMTTARTGLILFVQAVELRQATYSEQRFTRQSHYVLRIVVEVSIWQHALMQYSRNQNASALLTVKHDVLAMLHTTQASANLITESA
jgi:hypothetical protein